MKAFGRVVAVGGVMAAVVALALVVTSLIVRESGPSGEGLHVSTAQSEGPVASTPTPACAVRQEYDVELPEGCVPVDTEEMMRSNRRYKERMDPEVEAVNVAREQLPVIEEALMPLAEQRMVSPAEAREALAAAGYGDNVQIRPYVDDDSEPLPSLGIAVDTGGACVHGGVRAQAVDAQSDGVVESGVELDVGGYILDGGCLPAH